MRSRPSPIRSSRCCTSESRLRSLRLRSALLRRRLRGTSRLLPRRVSAGWVLARAALSPENLGLLEAVARLGSMAAAAREVGMVPSALTYRIRQVEDALDVLLFDRSARKLEVTDAGDAFYKVCVRVLDELESAERMLSSPAASPACTVTGKKCVAR